MNVQEEIIRNIKYLCAESVEYAKGGHVGSAITLSKTLFVLYTKIMKYDPDDPENNLRDIFILSNGHTSIIQYVLLTLIGHLSVEDLKKFRTLKSKTPGHPESHVTKGVEVTTGPLGQGIANSVGFAIACLKKNLDQKVYCIFGDGCYQEGISHEAFALAGLYNLKNLTFIYDYNKVTIDGPTEISMIDDVKQIFKSYNFDVYEIENDLNEIEKTLKIESERVKMIVLNTKIAEGTSWEGNYKIHCGTIGRKDTDNFKKGLKEFEISEATQKFFKDVLNEKRKEIKEKHEKFKKESEEFKNLKANFYKNIDSNSFILKKDRELKGSGTRFYFNDSLERLLSVSNNYQPIISGSADLRDSNLVKAKKMADFSKTFRKGNYIHYGIREHAMLAISNGISSEGTYIPISSTFLNFAMYGYTPIRLSAMSNLQNFFAFTHDSIGVGEDGPTHQPIEVLCAFRSMPNLYVLRPCDDNEVSIFLSHFVKLSKSVALILSRQRAKCIRESSSECLKGAYFIRKVCENPKITILSSGTEVSIALGVARNLNDKKIETNCVSFPSFELFEEQDVSYKRQILKGIVISIEAGATLCWYKYAKYCFGVDSFGYSAKFQDVYDYFELTDEKLTEKILKIAKKEIRITK